MLAMSYCILKMHKRTLLQKNFDMDKINEFLNHKLPENFLYDDDQVIEKLETCIEKILRRKFDLGPIMEPIPDAEIPKIPFGDFKKTDSRLENATHTHTDASDSKNKRNINNTNKDRDAFVEQMARDRLDAEKKKREEVRRRKREEKRLKVAAVAASQQNGDGIETFLVDGGKPIRNISDSDDDDDDDSESDDDSDDDDDDLNPSKLSEYDDDKMDKESMLSNLTRQSSPQHSLPNVSSLEKNGSLAKKAHAKTNGVASAKASESKLNSNSNSSIVNQISDYENLNSSSNFYTYNNGSYSKVSIHHFVY